MACSWLSGSRSAPDADRRGRGGPLAQRLASGGHDPAWSPTGDWIAFGVIAEQTRRIELVRPDGSDRHALADGASFAWSPDGSRMAFSAGTENPDLHLIEVDDATGAGSGQRMIADARDRDVDPIWTADGEVVIFHARVQLEGPPICTRCAPPAPACTP